MAIENETTEVQQPVQAVETQTEVKVRDYSDDELFEAVQKRQSVYDKVYEKARDKTLSKFLGVDAKDLTEEHRQTKFKTEKEYNELNNNFEGFKKETEAKGIYGENFDIMKPHIDYTKDLNEQFEEHKTKYSKLFEVKPVNLKPNDLSPKDVNGKTKEQQAREKLRKELRGE